MRVSGTKLIHNPSTQGEIMGYNELLAHRRAEDMMSEEMRESGYLYGRDREDRIRELYLVAVEQLEAEAAAETERVTAQIFHSVLADDVVAFYAEADEVERLTAERDAEIAKINERYDMLIPKYYKHVSSYNERRGLLLAERVAAAGLKVCFKCSIAKNDVLPVLLEGQFRNSHSDCSYNASTWLESYKQVMDLCSDCRASSIESPSKDRAGDSTFCLVREAERRDDGVYARYGKGWRKISKDTVVYERTYDDIHDMPDRLAKEWDIPPQLKSWGSSLFVKKSFGDDIRITPPASVAANAE